MGALGISLLMALGLAGFGLLAWRKLAIVQALQPQMRWDEPRQRLLSVLRNGLLQQRMLQREWKPGLMHAVIFLGFLSLLVRKVQLLVIGFHEPFVWPEAFGGPFAALKDVVEIAVTAAVLYAFWRRFVQRPARLEPNKEAVLVLGLILAIMVTDLSFDAFRFALLAPGDAGIAHEAQWAFAGNALAGAVSGWSPGALQAGYVGSYWLQMVVVFSFLVLLPAGEHFHIVTALPALFFRRGRPAHVVPKVDMDRLMEATDEADMVAGARTAADLTWKEGLDVFTCTECGRCKDACPTHLTGKPLSLKAVNDSLKHHLLEQADALKARGNVAFKPAAAAPAAGPAPADAAQPAAPALPELPPLVGPVISEDTLWACTTCGYCEAACPIELEHLDKFYRLRQHQVMIAGEFPHELKKLFEAYESQGNPWGLPSGARADWAKGLDVPRLESAERAAELEVVFYVGSALSYDPRGQKIARAFVSVLQAAGVRFAILGEQEGSTGECVRRLGNEMVFQALAGALVETLNGLGVRRIVTCDPHAMNSLRNEYPEFGGEYEVLHHSRFIADLLAQGRLRVRPALERVVFHDPCYLGRHNGEYDAPRAVLQQLGAGGAAPLEMTLNREKAMCCGAGGGRMWLEETIGKRINVLRVEQALEQRPATIATACPYCAVMVSDGLGALGQDGAVASKDIAELVAESLA